MYNTSWELKKIKSYEEPPSAFPQLGQQYTYFPRHPRSGSDFNRPTCTQLKLNAITITIAVAGQYTWTSTSNEGMGFGIFRKSENPIPSLVKSIAYLTNIFKLNRFRKPWDEFPYTDAGRPRLHHSFVYTLLV